MSLLLHDEGGRSARQRTASQLRARQRITRSLTLIAGRSLIARVTRIVAQRSGLARPLFTVILFVGLIVSSCLGTHVWKTSAPPLARTVELVESDPSIAVVGPKIRAWHERRLLLEVGVSIARSGRRETGLERREQDQGQHDGVHDRLAVSTAGMLVRRDVWEALGGLDRAFPLFRDDVDFGWRANLAGHRVVCCTDAVVYPAAAAARGR